MAKRYLTGGLDRQLAVRIYTTESGYLGALALLSNRQGTVLGAMRPNGLRETTVKSFSTDAFGKVAGADGAGTTNPEVGFAGASTGDPQGGFTYLRNRWYDPQTGRFLTQDPIGLAGGTNLYAYAGNNPVSFSDPYGLCPPLPDCLAQGLANWGASRGGALGTVALNAGAALNAGFEAFGINAASAAGEEIGSGDVVGGVKDAAILIGGAKLAGVVIGKLAGAGRALGTRYMGAGEAAEVARTGTIPATNAAGRPRVIHYTTDAPTTSAGAAQARYMLPETPTHMCQFPLCNVQNSVPPTGSVAPGATQAATSMPINGAGRPVPLDP